MPAKMKLEPSEVEAEEEVQELTQEDIQADKDVFDDIATKMREASEGDLDFEKLEQIGKLVSELKSPAAREAFNNLPQVQSLLDRMAAEDDELKPGQYRQISPNLVYKKPWTANDIDQSYDKVEVRWPTKETVIVNGITYNIPGEMEPVTVPSVVLEVLNQSLETLKESDRLARAGMLAGDVKLIGIGWRGAEREGDVPAGT